VLAGHIHPAISLSGPGGQHERLPCFLFGERIGLLPAFGGFTGGATVRPRRGDRVFALAGEEVVLITAV
jgi:metallophosphoesterase superfamily enzyme